jgi:nicotinate-nucleotide adenylyltransferase
MLRLACQGNEKLQVSDLEITRGGVSFTYETVAAVAEQHPGAEIFLLMGSDMLLSFHTWKNPEKILEKVTVAVLYRGDRDERTKVEARKVEMDAAGYRVELVANPVTEISSTQIRRLLAFQAADEFLPSGVGDYIRRSDLYDGNADWKNLPMEQLEQVVISLVKPSRVAHILGCRDTAVALAKRWGVDETDAARAGLLHDITKALDGPLQLTLCRRYGRVLDHTMFRRKHSLLTAERQTFCMSIPDYMAASQELHNNLPLQAHIRSMSLPAGFDYLQFER